MCHRCACYGRVKKEKAGEHHMQFHHFIFQKLLSLINMTSSTSQMSVHLCHDQSPPVETCHTGSVRRRQCVSKDGQRECVRTQLDVFMSTGGDVVSVSVLRHNEMYLNVSCCFVSLKKCLHIYKYSFSTQSNAIQTVENSPQPPLPTALSSDT